MSHSRSSSWVSEATRLKERFHTIMLSLRYMFPHSEVGGWELADWLEHRQELVEATGRHLGRAVALKQELVRLESQGLPPLRQAFDGKIFPQNLGSVLAMPTIWCFAWRVPWKIGAPWPSRVEMRWEGDDRARTRNGRFLPLPREPGNESVVWSHLPMVKSFELDQVWRVPTLEDTHLPVDEIEEHEIPNPWIEDLLNEIDDVDIF